MAKSTEALKIAAARAQLRFARVAPRKMRLVADLLRGKTVGEAQKILKFTRRPSAAPHIERLLKSAVANARQNNITEPEKLYVGRIMVDSGPMAKRFRPRAYGRAARIRKRSSHITMVLTQR
jgi:large subunit ribosomal protein L22